MIRVVIADDEPEVAQALKRNIDKYEDISVIAIAGNGQEVIEICGQLRPDVVLMDIRMPVMDGLAASKTIKTLYAGIQVIILTLFKEDEQVVQAVQSECDGYLLKGSKREKIVAAIKNVNMGISSFDIGVQSIISYQVKHSQVIPVDRSELNKLTNRQVDIVRLITAGKNNIEIADILHLGVGTVRNQICDIKKTLQINNSLELVSWGAKMGL